MRRVGSGGGGWSEPRQRRTPFPPRLPTILPNVTVSVRRASISRAARSVVRSVTPKAGLLFFVALSRLLDAPLFLICIDLVEDGIQSLGIAIAAGLVCHQSGDQIAHSVIEPSLAIPELLLLQEPQEFNAQYRMVVCYGSPRRFQGLPYPLVTGPIAKSFLEASWQSIGNDPGKRLSFDMNRKLRQHR